MSEASVTTNPPGTSTPLPDRLRGLRVGQDDETRINRTVHLAAAKIEALEAQVGVLLAQLKGVGSRSAPDRQSVSR